MSAEEVREEIFYPACAPEIKPAEVEPARPGSRPPSGLSPCTKDLVSELVILPTLGRITQDLIRLSDLLELRLGRLVVGVDVGVMLSGQAPVRLLDLLVCGASADAKDFVVVALIHARLLG